MTKSESREALKLQAWGRLPNPDIGLLARSYSALIRSARTNRNANMRFDPANQIIVYAMDIPAVVQHPEFIV